jgi:hypothetical protein
VDAALAAVGLVSLAGMLFAVRFLWLGIFPLWALAQLQRASVAAGSQIGRRRMRAWATAVTSVLLVPAFVWHGDWPMISRGVQWQTYDRPYPAGKNFAHAVWFLRDTELTGNLWNDYSSGNFLGYWLAPCLRTFVNSSLNVPKDVMEARHAIVQRGWGAGVAVTELLERYEVDVFFGTGEPIVSPSRRAPIYTTTHLENTPGWTLVFRNLRSALYLRADERNAANLGRVAAYYARAGVPFDPERGFDVERVLREAPGWAFEQGVVPANLADLESLARSLDPIRKPTAQARLASVWAVLGSYERAEALDRRILRSDPRAVGAARRRLWSLLHLGRADESLAAAEALAAIAAPEDALSNALVDAARGQTALAPADAAARVATLPVLTQLEGRQLFAAVQPPEARIPESPHRFHRCGRRSDGQ